MVVVAAMIYMVVMLMLLHIQFDLTECIFNLVRFALLLRYASNICVSFLFVIPITLVVRCLICHCCCSSCFGGQRRKESRQSIRLPDYVDVLLLLPLHGLVLQAHARVAS